ncbi:hypothetical protein H4R34_003714 [Dimargaris verticillata]|uniref:Uncharacterized protein n=1 Tax=Dimargaris verticillata TaxID=2761393 RepID=A0A9W8E8T8_9FUNG|nr:hypothetical protein H4R34_003714 [Dimargaris verticillata]
MPLNLLSCKGQPVADGHEFFLTLFEDHGRVDEFESTLYGGDSGRGGLFTLETVDGVSYLRHNDQYLVVQPEGHDHVPIMFVPDRPTDPATQALRMCQDPRFRSIFHLTTWDGSRVVHCEWIKVSYGYFNLAERSGPGTQFQIVLPEEEEPIMYYCDYARQ